MINWIGFVILEYLSCGFSTWDTGAHIQPVIHWALYGDYSDKMLNVAHPFLNHFRPALLLLSPIVYFFPTMLVIHLAKIIAFAIVPFIFLHYGKKYRLNNWAYFLPIMWTIHDVIINVMFAENQSTALTMPLIVIAFFLAYEKKYKTMLFPLIAMIFFKENMPLIWVCLGLFICIEQKEYRWGLGIICSGIFIGLSLFLTIIPYITNGFHHQHDSIAITSHIPEKIIMLIKAYLSVGFFVVLRPRTLIYTLPLYSVFLLGGSNVYRAFFLGAHTHDFTTTFLFCVAFFVLQKTLNGKTKLNTSIKWQRNLLKTTVVIMLLVGFVKLPIFRVIGDYHKIKAGLQIAPLAKQERSNLNNTYTIWTTPGLMDYFIDFKHIRSLDDKGYKLILQESNPLYIIFPTNERLYKMNKHILNTYKTVINQHVQEGLCHVRYLGENKENQLLVARYDNTLPTTEKKRIQTLFNTL